MALLRDLLIGSLSFASPWSVSHSITYYDCMVNHGL